MAKTTPLTTPAPQSADRPADNDDDKKSGRLRVGLAAGVGTSLEFYDFAIYGTASALVFGDVFFQTGDPWFGTFIALTTFAIGFLMAPIGAAVFGWLGDRKGRRTALLAAFVTMGVSTLLMGLLPSYAVMGVAAPVILVILRMFHGAARGGENQSAAVFAVEHAPENRRGLFGSFVAIGSPIGAMLANLAFAAVLLLPDDVVMSWGWRIPFFVGGLVLLVGLWVRVGVDETPAFEEMIEEQPDVKQKAPLVEAFRNNWRRILLAAGVNLGLTAMTFTLVTFMLSYATAAAPQGLALPRQPIVLGMLLGLFCHAVANVAAAMLSDRVGRRPVIVAGALLSIVAALSMFHITAAGTVSSVNITMIVCFAASGILFGPLYCFFTELFPASQRASGAGVGYHLGAVLGGGITPLIANRIVAGTGDAVNVGYYLAVLLVISLVCALVLPETAPVRLQKKPGRAAFATV